jgi:hypothetical protein
MPLTREQQGLHPGGAAGKATRESGDGCAWWTSSSGGKDPVDEEEEQLPNNEIDDGTDRVEEAHSITGNRLIDVEELASVGTLAKVFGLRKQHGTKGTAVSSIDGNRIKVYWGHWQKQSRHKTFDEFKQNSNAVIEHLFNDHTYCSDEWCPVLRAQARQEEYNGEYRSKVLHAREYEQIKTALAPYMTDDKLGELHHLFDSQKNESFNKSVSKYAPKGRTYSMTMALKARICIAAGVANAGAHEYWTRVLDRLGIVKGDHTEAFLIDKCRRTKQKHDYQCRIAVKRSRATKKNNKWRDNSKKQRKEENVGITYKPDVRNDDDEGEDSGCERPPSKKNKRSKCDEIPEDVAGEGDGERTQSRRPSTIWSKRCK